MLAVGELIQRLTARKTIPTRFSIEMDLKKLCNHLYAAYVAELNIRRRVAVPDAATKEHIRKAAEWLADGKGKFGLLLTGLYGNGKTTLMMAMVNLINWLFDSASSSERVSIRVVKAKEIAEMALDDRTRESFKKLYWEDMLAIDELGEEPPEILRYGMPHTPLRDLLEERYARQKLTIVTTNLLESAKAGKHQITEHYGARVADRFHEMMTIIPFTNPSYRTW